MAKSNSAVWQRGGFGKFFRGVKAELKKSKSGQQKKERINYTVLVFLVTILSPLLSMYLMRVFA